MVRSATLSLPSAAEQWNLKQWSSQRRSGPLLGRVLSACLQVPPDYWAAIDAAAHLAKRVVVLTVPTSIIGEPLRQQQGLWQQRNKV